MGCEQSVASSNKYNDLYTVVPKTKAYRRDFQALGISESDCGKLYHLFSKIDMDGSGEIEILELLMFLDVERTRFTKRIFSIFDDDKSGQIDFREFVLSIWNYCTLGKSSLTIFAFDLYDMDKSGNIDLDEAQTLIKDVYGAKFEQNVHARKTYSKLGALNTKQIDLDTFKEFSRKHQALLYPAFEMQSRFQRRVIGNIFWATYCQMRMNMFKERYVPIEEILAQFESRYNVGDKYKLGRLQSTEDVLDLQYTGDKADMQELTAAQRLQDEANRRGVSVGILQQELGSQKRHVIRNQRTGKDIIPVSRGPSINNLKSSPSVTSGVLEAKELSQKKRKRLSRTQSLQSATVYPTDSKVGSSNSKVSSNNDVCELKAGNNRRLSHSISLTVDGYAPSNSSVAEKQGRRASVAGGNRPSFKAVGNAVMLGVSGTKKPSRRGSVM